MTLTRRTFLSALAAAAALPAAPWNARKPGSVEADFAAISDQLDGTLVRADEVRIEHLPRRGYISVEARERMADSIRRGESILD